MLDFVAVPFGLVSLASGLIMVALVYKEVEPGWLLPFSAPFILFGVHLAVGRFFWDAFERRRTRYALTNRRALIVVRAWGQVFYSLPITRETTIRYHPGREARIYFAREKRRGGEHGPEIADLGFEFLEDGDAVERLVRKIQAGRFSE